MHWSLKIFAHKLYLIMYVNEFLKNPISIIVYDPIADINLHTYVFVGNIPKNVFNAIGAKNKTILKEYYGADYAKILCFSDVKGAAQDTIGTDRILIDDEFSNMNATNYIKSKKYDLFCVHNLATDTMKISPTMITEDISERPGPPIVMVDKNKIVLVDGNLADSADVKVINADDLEKCRIDHLYTQIIGADDFEDIESMLAGATYSKQFKTVENVVIKEIKAPITQTPGIITYVQSPQIFPDDSIQCIKEKIFLVAKIPLYRQHIFATESGRLIQPYNLYAGDQIIVDIRQKSTKMIKNMPIDRALYDAKGDIHVEACDQFILAKHWPKQIYVCDLALYIHTSGEILTDRYQFDLVYYGFVIKFWPQLTHESFRDYLADETDLDVKYPELCGDYNIIKTKYVSEQEIIVRTYNGCNKIVPALEIAITRLTAVVSTQAVINIRNLFDRLHTTICVPEIHAYIERDGKQYFLQRRHNRARDIVFPTSASTKQGIMIAISLRKSDQTNHVTKQQLGTLETEQSRYIFLNIRASGHYHVHTAWNEEDKFGFSDVMKNIHKFLAPVFSRINAEAKYIYDSNAQLILPTAYTTTYRGLNISIYWKQQLTTAAFKALRSSIDEYMKAGITVPREARQFDKFEFIIQKGVYEYDTATIDHVMAISNQYAKNTDKTVKLKWDQLYGGRTVRISNRTTDIRFEVLEVGDDEFKNILMYIAGFIQIQKPGAAVVVNYEKKLKKLRELDPDLYNLKKYGSNKIYSIKCQNKHQPMIYTDDEIANMGPKAVAKLTKYWNFTLSKPAYYGCDNKLYPHLSFIAGVHPRGYCMPCCNKKDQNRGMKHNLYQECLKNHTYNKTTIDNSRHIMSYGKEIELGRLSKCPHILSRDVFLDASVYLFGVQQHTLSAQYVGILFALSEILKITAAEFINKIITSMDEQLFASIGGEFASAEDLIDALSSILTCNLVRIIEWKNIFITAARIIFDLAAIIFNDNSAMEISMFSQIPSNNYGIIVEYKRRFYPAFLLEPDQFFKRGAIIARTFNIDDPIIVNIFAIIRFGLRNQVAPIDIAFMIEFAAGRKYKIEELLISMQNKCYAAVISRDDKKITCPLAASSYPTGHKLRFTPINSADASDIETIRGLIDEINSFVIMGTKYAQINISANMDTNNDILITDCGIFRIGENKLIDDINDKIYLRTPPSDSRQSKLGAAIYKNHLYRLFLLEFVNHVRRDENAALRATIIELIKGTNFKKDNAFRTEIANLVSEAADRKKIFTMLARYYKDFDKAKFISDFTSSQYFFDAITFTKLKSLSGQSLIAAIKARAEIFCVVGTVSDISFKNIYTACSQNGNDYCEGNKLIVPNIDELCDLLAADLQNDLKMAHLFDLSDAVVDYFQFEEEPHETVTIFRI